MRDSPEATYHNYLRLIAAGPLRARDAAEKLGVSEAELVAAKATAGLARRFAPAARGGFAGLLRAMPAVGEVMVLTRNEHCVHESHGAYGNVDIGEAMGVAVNGGVDLRLFMRHWVFAFAVEEELGSGKRLSLQFFDRAGGAVHKIYATEATDRPALDALIAAWIDPAPPPLRVEPHDPPKPDRPDAEIDAAGLRAGWLAMRDTHEFIALLRRHGAGREQALRLAGTDLAVRVDPDTITRVLEAASEREAPIMIFVQNRGCIQIHNGPVKHILPTGPWINVLDPRFNLHLRTDAVARAWVVRKPTADGLVTALELYDAAGEVFCILHGQRKPGQVEREDWRAILADTAPEVVA